MKKYKIKQVKSGIGRTQRQKDTLYALGLHKINQIREVEGSPQVLGMIEKVRHLITIEEV
ncbi:MAG: 50S ribosomal protein L30 [Bacteroidales bacterium]|nr:50S ribosomal protein L30 [Bacteroidales bacterium]